MKPVWLGHITNGRLQLEKEERFAEYIQQFEAKPVELTIEEAKRHRSTEQNRYYWGVVVEMLSKKTGYSKDEMHEILKLKFNPIRVKIAEEEITVGGTTTEMDTLQFSNYNESIKVWAAEVLHIYIPDPNEVSFET